MDDFHVQPISFTRTTQPEPSRAINESQAISDEGGGGNASYGQSSQRQQRESEQNEEHHFEDHVAPEVIERARQRRHEQETTTSIPNEMTTKTSSVSPIPTTDKETLQQTDELKIDKRAEPRNSTGPMLRFNNGEGTSTAVLDDHEMQALRAERLDIELITTAPLPGPASLWISQYADHLARRSGVAALLRLSETDLEIELFFGDSQPRPQRLRDLIAEPMILRASDERAEAREQLTQTLELLATHVSHWAIHLDQPEQVWPELPAWAPTWTVLTGADQAAAVAAYRRIKTITMDSAEFATEQPKLRVMFLGCAVQQANDAATRIHRAAATFLDTPIEWAGFRQRMNPLKRSQILSAETKANHLSETLEEFLEHQSQIADLGPTPNVQPTLHENQQVRTEFDDLASNLMEGLEDTPDIETITAEQNTGKEATDSLTTDNVPYEPEIIIPQRPTQNVSNPEPDINQQPPLTSIPSQSRAQTHPADPMLDVEPYDMPDFNTSGHVIKDNTQHFFEPAFTNASQSSDTVDSPDFTAAPLIETVDTTVDQPLHEDESIKKVIEQEQEKTEPHAAESSSHIHDEESRLIRDQDSTEPGRHYSTAPAIEERLPEANGAPTPDHLEDAYPGSVSVGFHPPQYPKVKIYAVKGITHLGRFASCSMEQTQTAIYELLQSADWAREQSEILNSAIPGLSHTPQDGLVLDLFLEKPADAMRWLSLLGTRAQAIRPHLLKPLKLNHAPTQWIHEALF